MLRNCSLREREDVDNLTADAGAASGEDVDDFEPCRVSQCLELLSQTLIVRMEISEPSEPMIADRRLTINRH